MPNVQEPARLDEKLHRGAPASGETSAGIGAQFVSLDAESEQLIAAAIGAPASPALDVTALVI